MSDGSVLHFSPRGAMQFHDLGAGVAIHACVGISEAEFARLVIADGNRLIEKYGNARFFVDLWDGRMMTTEFREGMTGWLKEQGDRVNTHILIRSKLIEMGIRVAKLVLREELLHAYSRIQDWEAAGRAFVPTFARRPLVERLDFSAASS